MDQKMKENKLRERKAMMDYK